MTAHHLASDDLSTLPTTLSTTLSTTPSLCYFSILPAAHFSAETPSTSPVSEYQACTPSDPAHPLLAFRPGPPSSMSPDADAERLLQLQTDASHRPSPDPLQPQHRASSASSSSSNSSASSSNYTPPSTLSCCRCRRQCLANMYQIGTNRYYCSHCARMTGYSAG
ncbi:hypothetical protein COCHEDRAFT_1204399 [Bipolaris maydis C5]|uniref:Uncharacterized protein n=2 Tax=Cochliobolus heterostrophus TaxID=5016 RepID=M2U7F0_COCH5|nr:hypothetical protein COCHEDRAFT_1204399 [Bipolaris maydis C5]KAJ5025600.1 hypothetical protein J3E73DRAFT_382698 [Bipolaris maydis]KAJ6196649.1 hypothetical protein J3E72DRAFT_439810 [Bipolaris maydis]KAJ6207535.1 hypothetical protein PSV09DRAFT_1204399 [Bipolaris maydis]KAJ6269813.1 hypothetical protein PSV08DRAFT_392713 [Bipolaris maydis]